MGPWLPPQRTFSALVAGAPLQAEQVLSYVVGLDRALDATGSRVIRVRRFIQSTGNQVTTLFGLDERSAVGHYYVATPGDVHVDGWSVGLGGHFIGLLSGSIDYAFARGDWTSEEVSRVVQWLAPSTIRRGEETLQDVTTSLFATIPRTSTQVSVTYRLNTAFSGPSRSSRLPGLDGRFNVEVRQELPYQPLKGGRLEVVFAARNLLRDAAEGGSHYDELLTVSPPLRLLGGVQVRF